MTITVTCDECSKTYALKDELAGKKIRCKECEVLMTVPVPKKTVDKSDDEFPLDELFKNTATNDDDDDFDDLPRRPPKMPIVQKKTPVRKPRTRRFRLSPEFGANLFAGIVKLLKFAVAFCVLFAIAFAFWGGDLTRLIPPDLMPFSVTWTAYAVPGAPGCTVEMPKAPENKTNAQGNPLIFSEVRGFAVGAASENVTSEVAVVFANLQQNQRAVETGMQTIMPQGKLQGSRIFPLYGSQAIEFTFLTGGNVYVIKRAFLANGRCITLDFISNQTSHAEMPRYFDSFKGPGISNVPNVNTVPAHQGQANPTQASQAKPNPTQTHQAQPNQMQANQTQTNPMQANQAQANPMQAHQSGTKSNMTGDHRKVWKYTNASPKFGEKTNATGSFVKGEGNQWKEERQNASPIHMIESARTNDYIELSRNNGRFLIRLYANRSTFSMGNTANFIPLYPGKWE